MQGSGGDNSSERITVIPAISDLFLWSLHNFEYVRTVKQSILHGLV